VNDETFQNIAAQPHNLPWQMTIETPRALPERENTDESLHLERTSTDAALATNQQRSKAADVLVGHARANADTALDAAREHADDQLEDVQSGEQAVRAVVRERALEDDILLHERRLADARLRHERDSLAQTIESLLSEERARTDRYLLNERNRADDELANRDDFLGMVSHDLRNLLNGISLNASILSARAAESQLAPHVIDGTNKIKRYVARMDRLISDLVDVVSIDKGKLSIRPRPCDPAGLVTEVSATFSQLAADKGVTLRVTPDGLSRRNADLDRERVMQVLENLISNAVKFTPAGGEVRVTGETSDEGLLICVADTGCGIPGDLLELIFERFWQAAKNDQRGLGLGLYISRCIVEAHGGKIWAKSTVGKGSDFHFLIPNFVAGQLQPGH